MATIEFTCPECGQICAFQDRFVGRRARCTKCSTYFLIPPAGQPARTLKPALSVEGPFSGFWPALLKGTPKALLHPNSLSAIAIMVIMSILRFFYGHPMFIISLPLLIFVVPVPVGIFVSVLTILSQSRYLFNVIQSTADQSDPFPLYLDGTYVDRFYDAIISAYILLTLTTLFLAPAGLTVFVLKKAGFQTYLPAVVPAAVGLFFLPLSMTIYAYSRDLVLSLRLNFIVRAARKAFWPHLTLYAQMLVIAALLWKSSFFSFKAPPETLFYSAVFHALVAVFSLVAARTAGLFYRHYGCYLP
jgi:hypothetical protein